METKVISIHVKKVRELKKLIEENGPFMLSDAVRQFGQHVVGALLATEKDIVLIPDGGVLRKEDV